MSVNFLKLIILFFVPVIIFWIPYILEKRNVAPWVIRKFTHSSGLSVVALYGSLLDSLEEIAILIIAVAIYLLIFTILPTRLFFELVRMGTREGESQTVLAFNSIFTTLFAFLLLLLTINFDLRWIFMASIFSVALGDGLGELIGRPYGKHKYQIFSEKSVEGSLGVFIGTLIGAGISVLLFGSRYDLFQPFIIPLLLLVALVGMLLEALSYSFLDNIIMPPSIAAILWFLS